MPKVRLNQRQHFETTPPCPPGKRRIELCDEVVPGLLLEVRATSPGRATIYLRFKNSAGKTAYTKIGTTLDTTLKQARIKARQLKADIAAGANPQAEARQRKAVPTFREFFTATYLPEAKRRKRTWKDDEDMFRLRIDGRFGGIPLNKITRQAIQQFHSELPDEGLAPASADLYLQVIHRVLRVALDFGITDANPATGVRKFRADNRMENYLTEQQMQRLLAVLDEHENRPVCAVILWLLATGCRLGEALGATWSDVDLDRRIWGIPAEKSKNGRRGVVYLNEAAISVLDGLKRHPDHDALFVGRRGPLTSIYRVWYAIRDSAGLPEFRLHDLRHSHASLLINSGCTLSDVQHALRHQSYSTTLRYAHMSDERRRNTADVAGNVIQGAMRR